MKNMETKFIIDGNTTLEVVEVGDYLVPAANMMFKTKNYTLYDNKLDVMYAKLIRDLSRGKDISSYKRSKYYQYYVGRLKEENPEYYI